MKTCVLAIFGCQYGNNSLSHEFSFYTPYPTRPNFVTDLAPLILECSDCHHISQQTKSRISTYLSFIRASSCMQPLILYAAKAKPTVCFS